MKTFLRIFFIFIQFSHMVNVSFAAEIEDIILAEERTFKQPQRVLVAAEFYFPIDPSDITIISRPSLLMRSLEIVLSLTMHTASQVQSSIYYILNRSIFKGWFNHSA